jgi:hypothetical protein
MEQPCVVLEQPCVVLAAERFEQVVFVAHLLILLCLMRLQAGRDFWSSRRSMGAVVRSRLLLFFLD